MIPKPNHIKRYVEKLHNKSKYVEYEFDEYTIPYEVKCSCGNKEFIVYNNLEPRVELECTKCGNKIIVYDLDWYTCAEKYMEEEMNLYISPDGDMLYMNIQMNFLFQMKILIIMIYHGAMFMYMELKVIRSIKL